MNPLLTNHLIGFALVSIVLPLVAVIVYFNRSRHILKSIFAFYTLAISWWAFFTMFMITAGDGRWGMFWDRMCLTGTVFIPSSFFHFIIAYTRGSDRLKNLIRTNYGISLLFLVVLWFTPWFIKDVAPKFGMNYFSVPGPLYLVFVVFFLECVVGAMYFLWNFQKGLPPSRLKKQAQYLFWFSVIGYGGGSCNYLLVYDINLPGVAETSNYGVLILSIAIAYIIFRFQFLDIEVIIKKTIVFAGIVVAAACVISIPAGLIQLVIGRSVGIPPFWLMVSGIATAVLMYRPLERWLVTLTDRFLFQKKYNYHKLLKENSKQLSFIKSLDEMARQIVTFLVKQGRIRSAGILMRSSDQKRFELKHPLGYGGRRNRPSFSMENDHALVKLLAERKTPLVLERLEKEAKEIPSEFSVLEEIREVMKRLKAEVIIPSFLGNSSNNQVKNNDSGLQLRNLLVLGPKKSDEEYTDEDLDVFFTIAQDSAIAAENARLYDEAVSRTQELQAMNRELNRVQGELIHALSQEEQSRKQAEQAKEAALEAKKKTEEMELELIRREKLLFVEKLVKGLSHEIYNALQPMSYRIDGLDNILTDLYVFFDQMKDKLPKEEKARLAERFHSFREVIEALNISSDHISGVVDTLNQMRKGDDKTIKAFDFLTFWINTMSMIQIQSHGDVLEEVPVVEDIPANLPPVLGNPVQLAQVFLNLYRNALQAMNGAAQKKVMIEAQLDPDSPGFLSVSFSDSGAGIPPDVLPRIFDLGFSTKGDQGQGIGLNMCKTILERFGASIGCQSAVGKGTAFFIKLPLAENKSQSAK